MRNIILLGPALAIALLAGSARSQTFEEVDDAAQAVQHVGQRPFLIFTHRYALPRHWSVNAFYVVRDRPGPNANVHWVIRRTWWSLTDERGVLWADSRTCTGMADVLDGLETLVGPSPVVPGRGRLVAPPAPDGAYHTLRQQFARDGNDATVSLEVSGNMDSVLADWWAATTASLRGCWTETEPGT
jgi:hypothetical protein